MKSIKLLVLLVALAGAGLTACNSGSSGTQSPKLNTVVSNESVTATKLDESAGITLSNPLQDTNGTIGAVITKGGNLDYYQNDKFIGVVHKFEDYPSHVQIAQVGIKGQSPTIIYVTTYVRHTYRSDKEQGVIHKCVLPPSGGKFECLEIYRDDKGVVYNINFDGNGNGYAMSSKGLLNFVGDRLLGVRTDIKNLIPAPYANAGNEFLTATHNPTTSIYTISEYSGFSDNQPKLHTISSNNRALSSISIDSRIRMEGYSICHFTGDSSKSDYSLCSISDGTAVKMNGFEDYPTGLSSLVSSVYVSTINDSTSSMSMGKGELKKCTYSGYCSTIDKFDTGAMDVSFKTY